MQSHLCCSFQLALSILCCNHSGRINIHGGYLRPSLPCIAALQVNMSSFMS